MADENMEPWALFILRYRKMFDVIDCDEARVRGCDDQAVFARAWHLRRVLITHDEHFLDDTGFHFANVRGLWCFLPFLAKAGATASSATRASSDQKRRSDVVPH